MERDGGSLETIIAKDVDGRVAKDLGHRLHGDAKIDLACDGRRVSKRLATDGTSKVGSNQLLETRLMDRMSATHKGDSSGACKEILTADRTIPIEIVAFVFRRSVWLLLIARMTVVAMKVLVALTNATQSAFVAMIDRFVWRRIVELADGAIILSQFLVAVWTKLLDRLQRTTVHAQHSFGLVSDNLVIIPVFVVTKATGKQHVATRREKLCTTEIVLASQHFAISWPEAWGEVVLLLGDLLVEGGRGGRGRGRRT